jgi:hypothetical protein
MSELYRVTPGASSERRPKAKAPDETVIWDIDQDREIVRMPGQVILPIGAIVQLGRGGDRDDPPRDGIVRAVRLWGVVPGGRPVVRLDVELTVPA